MRKVKNRSANYTLSAERFLNLMTLRCHTTVKDFIKCLPSGNKTIQDTIAMCGNSHAWFAVSSTGIALEHGKLTDAAQCRGLHDTDPLEWLLYRNGVLPASFDKDDAKKWAMSFYHDEYQELKKAEKDLEDAEMLLEECKSCYSAIAEQSKKEESNKGQKIYVAPSEEGNA